MKRFLKYALPVAFILFLAVPARSAELTLSEVNRGTLGPLRVLVGFATTASADTLPFPFKNVTNVILTPSVTALSQDTPMVWYSKSGSTITVYVHTDTGDATPVNASIRVDYFIVGF